MRGTTSASGSGVRVAVDAPPGYSRFLTTRGAEVVALTTLARTVREAMAYGTLYEYAARQMAERGSGAVRLEGRGPVYAVTLPDRVTRVVIRHARHGGLLAPITGDAFLAPTRAPRELAVAARLREAGVRTPEVVAYALYQVVPFVMRSDVATRQIVGRDLGESLRDGTDPTTRRALLSATVELLQALGRTGARHPDLNVKNVLLSPAGDGAFEAHVLDVDRIRMRTPGDPRVAAGNLERLLRSARKWRERHGVQLGEDEMAWLAEQAGRTRAA